MDYYEELAERCTVINPSQAYTKSLATLVYGIILQSLVLITTIVAYY